MPARSEAQRKMLNARFGHAWVKRHHFDNSGPLPARVKKKGGGAVKKKPAKKKGKKKAKGRKCPTCGKSGYMGHA